MQYCQHMMFRTRSPQHKIWPLDTVGLCAGVAAVKLCGLYCAVRHTPEHLFLLPTINPEIVGKAFRPTSKSFD